MWRQQANEWRLPTALVRDSFCRAADKARGARFAIGVQRDLSIASSRKDSQRRQSVTQEYLGRLPIVKPRRAAFSSDCVRFVLCCRCEPNDASTIQQRQLRVSSIEPTTPVGVGGSAAVRAPRTSDLYGISGEQLFDLRQRLHLPPEAAPSASAADASSAAAAPSSEQQQYPHGYVMSRLFHIAAISITLVRCGRTHTKWRAALRTKRRAALSPATIDQRRRCVPTRALTASASNGVGDLELTHLATPNRELMLSTMKASPEGLCVRWI